MFFITRPTGVQVQGIPQGENEMKVRYILLVVLVLAITVASCGGEDIDYESIAVSFEEAINAGDADAAASLLAEDGHFETHQDPGDINTPLIPYEGKDELRECFQILIDSGIKLRFSGYKVKGEFLCFEDESSLGATLMIGSGVSHLRFEGEKITWLAVGCPGGW